MHILVTRAPEDAGDLQAKLEARGHRVSLAPLIGIEYLPLGAGSFDKASAIVATSRNGLRAIARSPAYHAAQALPLFVVGSASAQLAQELMFRACVAGPGRASELAPLVLNHARAHDGRVVLVTGDETAFDMETYLRSRGVDVQSVIAYCARPSASLPEPILDSIKKNDIKAVVLMSARTASTWISLTTKADLVPQLAKITHMCLSSSIARVLETGYQGHAFSLKIETARRPEIEEILALAGRLAAQSGT